MSDFAGCITVAVILAAFSVLMAAHCRAQARTRRTYGITPRRRPKLAELAQPGPERSDLDWPHVRRTLCAMQAKDITEESR